jgi:hypothetical protein
MLVKRGQRMESAGMGLGEMRNLVDQPTTRVSYGILLLVAIVGLLIRIVNEHDTKDLLMLHVSIKMPHSTTPFIVFLSTPELYSLPNVLLKLLCYLY